MPSRMEPLINGVELLSTKPLKLDEAAILASLKKQFNQVDTMVSSPPDSPGLVFAFLDYMVQYQDGKAPAQIIIVPHRGNAPESLNLQPYIQQTWDWDEAEAVVSACPHSAMMMDLMASGLEPQRRIEFFQKALYAILQVVPCEAIAWRTSQKIVNPQAFITNFQSSQPDPLFGALNVRMFNIQDTDPPQVLMDTTGLAFLGLPDIQCHYVKLEPSRVAGLLMSVGHYIFEHGDIINDGETVQGFQPEDRWLCRHEEAMVEPHREVLDINPGSEFSEGTRD